MVTVLRAHGLRFVIYPNDHEPAHVHVIGAGEMKVDIRGADGLPAIVWAIGMKARERRLAMDVILEAQVHLLARWNETQEAKS